MTDITPAAVIEKAKRAWPEATLITVAYEWSSKFPELCGWYVTAFGAGGAIFAPMLHELYDKIPESPQ